MLLLAAVALARDCEPPRVDGGASCELPGICSPGFLLDEEGRCARWRLPRAPTQPRNGGELVDLGDGSVLLIGGLAPYDDDGTYASKPQPVPERYADGRWTPLPAEPDPALGYHTVRLAHGGILRLGGIEFDDTATPPRRIPLRKTHVLDPATGWTVGPEVPTETAFFAVAALPDGGALLVDEEGSSWILRHAKWVRVKKVVKLPRRWTRLVAVPDGRVLLLGGEEHAETVFAFVKNKKWKRLADRTATTPGAAVPLEDGRIWLVGGWDAEQEPLPATSLFDPRTNTFVAGPTLEHPRTWPTVVKAAGQWLVMGGAWDPLPVEAADPALGGLETVGPALPEFVDAWSQDDDVLVVLGGDQARYDAREHRLVPSVPDQPRVATSFGGQVYLASDTQVWRGLGEDWEALPDLPGRVRWAVAMDTVYVGTSGSVVALRNGVWSEVRDVQLDEPVVFANRLVFAQSRQFYGAATGWASLPELPEGADVTGPAVVAADGVHTLGASHLRFDGEAWTVLAPLDARRDHAAIGLADGRILVAGGIDETGEMRFLEDAWLYDPATDAWTETARMRDSHWGFSLVPLGERILAVGGAHELVESWHPDTGWTPTIYLNVERRRPDVVVLDGRLYVVGRGKNVAEEPATLEVYEVGEGVLPAGGDVRLLSDREDATIEALKEQEALKARARCLATPDCMPDP